MIEKNINSHLDYISDPQILYQDSKPSLLKINDSKITNGLGVSSKAGVYIEIAGNKIMIPAPFHPMLLSAVQGNAKTIDKKDHQYITYHNGKQNGPFLGAGCAKWLQEFAVNSAKIINDESLNETENKRLLNKLSKLNEEDLTHHGRIGEGLYIILDMMKAKAAGHSNNEYKSPSFGEFCDFIKDIENYYNNNTEIQDPAFRSLSKIQQKLFKEIADTKGAIHKYTTEQFPKMLKENNDIAYYNLAGFKHSKDVNNTINNTNFNKDFENKINNQDYVQKIGLRTVDEAKENNINKQKIEFSASDQASNTKNKAKIKLPEKTQNSISAKPVAQKESSLWDIILSFFERILAAIKSLFGDEKNESEIKKLHGKANNNIHENIKDNKKENQSKNLDGQFHRKNLNQKDNKKTSISL